jgi:hypothetical protein
MALILACIIRERHATEGFGRQRIAEEEDGSVKLMPWDMAAGFAGTHHRGCDDFGAWLCIVLVWVRRKWELFRGAKLILPRRRSQFQGHVPEGRQKRERLRQMYDHASR